MPAPIYLLVVIFQALNISFLKIQSEIRMLEEQSKSQETFLFQHLNCAINYQRSIWSWEVGKRAEYSACLTAKIIQIVCGFDLGISHAVLKVSMGHLDRIEAASPDGYCKRSYLQIS